MTKSILSFIILLLITSSAMAQELKNDLDSVSYSVGILIAKNLKALEIPDVPKGASFFVQQAGGS